MKFSIVISTLFALLIGSVNAQSEVHTPSSSVSKPRSVTSSGSKPTGTSTPVPSLPTPTGTTSIILPPAATPVPSVQSTSSSGAVPTAFAGIQQVALAAAGLVGAAIL